MHAGVRCMVRRRCSHAASVAARRHVVPASATARQEENQVLIRRSFIAAQGVRAARQPVCAGLPQHSTKVRVGHGANASQKQGSGSSVLVSTREQDAEVWMRESVDMVRSPHVRTHGSRDTQDADRCRHRETQRQTDTDTEISRERERHSHTGTHIDTVAAQRQSKEHTSRAATWLRR